LQLAESNLSRSPSDILLENGPAMRDQSRAKLHPACNIQRCQHAPVTLVIQRGECLQDRVDL